MSNRKKEVKTTQRLGSNYHSPIYIYYVAAID